METKRLDSRGMVVDFSDIKKKLKHWVDENWDHRMILNSKDPGLAGLKKLDTTVMAVPCNPTAENLARLLFKTAKKMGFPVIEVRLWETENSWAAYSESST